MSDELLQGWVECEMGDVAKVVGGGTPDSQDPENFSTESGVPWLTPADLSDNKAIHVARGRRFLTKKGFDNSSARLVPKGTVLFSSRAPIGYVAVAANEISTNQGFKSFVCADGMCSEYTYFWLRFATPMAEELASGTTFAEISGKNAARIPLRLAPLAEQRRIVARQEKLLGQVDACRQRLAKIPALLKRFRQSVLAAACSGRLTADWREGNDSPEAWRNAEFSEFIDSSFYGPRFSKESYSTKGVPTIRTTDMGFDGSIVLKNAPRLALSRSELEKFGLHDGVLLVTRTGATIGKCALYDKSIGPAIPGAYLIRFRLKCDLIAPKFVLLYFMSPAGQNLLVGGSTAVAQPNVNATTISQFEIPIAPLLEQQEIVRRVESMFVLAAQIEARFTQARRQVEQLAPSLLARAFCGQLVPQHPNDEPAPVLLERIRSRQGATVTNPGRWHRRSAAMKP